MDTGSGRPWVSQSPGCGSSRGEAEPASDGAVLDHYQWLRGHVSTLDVGHGERQPACLRLQHPSEAGRLQSERRRYHVGKAAG